MTGTDRQDRSQERRKEKESNCSYITPKYSKLVVLDVDDQVKRYNLSIWYKNQASACFIRVGFTVGILFEPPQRHNISESLQDGFAGEAK